MSNENVAVIQFIGYRVTNILYNCDPSFELPQGEVPYKFNFSKSLAILSETEVQENVCANVFYCPVWSEVKFCKLGILAQQH